MISALLWVTLDGQMVVMGFLGRWWWWGWLALLKEWVGHIAIVTRDGSKNRPMEGDVFNQVTRLHLEYALPDPGLASAAGKRPHMGVRNFGGRRKKKKEERRNRIATNSQPVSFTLQQF